MFSSCGREVFSFDNGEKDNEVLAEGQLNLTSLKVAVEAETDGVISRANINTADFIIRIFDKNQGNKIKEWKYSEMPEIFSLKVGSYLVAAYSHDIMPAEFDRPYFYGSQSFDITADNITDIEVLKCFLRSIKVTVEYADNLRELLGDDVIANVSVGEGALAFTKNEVRAGHFQATNETVNLLATLTGTIDGAIITPIEKAFPGVKAGEHRIIRYSMKEVDEGGNGSGGSAGVTIVIDATCEIVDVNVDVDPGTEEGVPDFPGDGGGDDGGGGTDNPDLPTIVGDGFDITTAIIDVSEASFASPISIKVNIGASKGIRNLNVEIISDTLTPSELEGVGLADKFDLANPGGLAEGLSGLGFPVGEEVIGQTSVLFDITNFTPLIPALGSGTHKFKINVVDQDGNSVTETLTLKS